MEIRTLKLTDIDLLLPLIDQLVSANKTLPFRPDYRIAFRDSAKKVLNETDAVIFIAEAEGEIIGLIAGRISDNGTIIFPDKIGYIGTLVVLSGHRRKGIAKALWKKLKEWFLSKGIDEAQLYVLPDNEEAKSFWKNCGFNIILERWKNHL